MAPAAAALGLLDILAVSSMGRLFHGSGWVVPVLGSAVVTHLVSWWARRARLGLAPAAAGSAAVVFLVLVWSVLGASTFYGIPTLQTLRLFAHDVAGARSAFANLVAPVPTLPGFVLVAGSGAALVGLLADWAAFRLRTLLESVVPALAVVVFVSVLAPTPPGAAVTGLLAAAIAAYVAVNESARRAGRTAHFTGGGRRERLLGQAGAGMVAIVALGGAVVGPHLPGASSKGLVALHHRGPSASNQRTTISPLVDIRARLVSQANTELFTVTAPMAAYWRLTSLDTFDGNIWSSDESYSPAAGSLPGKLPAVGHTAVAQRIQIDSLGSIWLPAAYIPSDLTGGAGVSWDPVSQSLIGRSQTSDGEIYSVTSSEPRFSGSELRAARSSSLPSSTVTQYTKLPPAVPADVVGLARRITAGHSTPFDRALALQNYLRNNYRYSLSVPPGHSDSAIDNFLFRTKTGYCEQFAGSFAVMARAVGLASRVAVGFTPGQQDASGVWHVFGSDAHAWPEVLLGQFGWVAFEPTPGRGNPAATSYSGVAAAQAGGPGQSGPAATSAAAPTSSPPPTSRHITVKESAPRPLPARIGPPPLWLIVAAVLLVAVVIWTLGLPAARRARRNRRRRRAVDEADRVLAAWQDANGWLDLLNRSRQAEETLLDHARRAVDGIPLRPETADALRDLAERASAASYAPALPAGSAQVALEYAKTVEHGVVHSAGRWRRLGRELDPRRFSRV
jgi:transglutaminase-like putative cysteine protease